MKLMQKERKMKALVWPLEVHSGLARTIYTPIHILRLSADVAMPASFLCTLCTRARKDEHNCTVQHQAARIVDVCSTQTGKGYFRIHRNSARLPFLVARKVRWSL